MNSWNFTGNTGRAAEIKFLPNGDPITTFSVNVKAGYGKNQVDSWVNCSLYGKRGESVAPFITKGVQIGVSGEALLREWTNKEGAKQSSLECRVNDVTLMGSKPIGENGQTQSQDHKPNEQKFGGFASEQDFEDSIPF